MTPPPHRFDIAIEADLIEEVARIVGFEAIPETDALVPQRFAALAEAQPAGARVARGARGARLSGGDHLRLRRSCAAGAAVPRACRPRARQPDRQRPVGHARVALAGAAAGRAREPAPPAGSHPAVRARRALRDRGRRRRDAEIDTLAGIACGRATAGAVGPAAARCASRRTSTTSRAISRRCLRATGARGGFTFEPAALSCLHPGPAARRAARRRAVGWLGELHPTLVKALDFTYAPVLFELDVVPALRCRAAALIRRFRASRRCGATSPWWWMNR